MATTFQAGRTDARVAPITAATLVALPNGSRKVMQIVNMGTVRVYFGTTSSLTVANASWYLDPGDTYSNLRSTDAYYGITSAGTGDIGVEETM